ncbi:uncharacterized protein LOC134836267 [Culicoides brevitarsis]|uniref:uncharacterized protein LOC134836267 n=1 Tax=Culicoides brevitarsis TaxID=469753 RepID=UPI00307C1A63
MAKPPTKAFPRVEVVAQEDGDRTEVIEKFASACYGKDGIEKPDFDHIFREHKQPETMPQKCLITCMQEQVEIIKGDKFQPETFKAIVRGAVNDEKHNHVIDEIAKECASVTDVNRCEQGMKLSVCYKETAEKHGVDFDKLHGM